MIAFDASSNGSVPGSTGLLVSHVVGSGSNRAIVACVQTNRDIQWVRYNNVDMTKMVESSGTFRASVWALANPDAGTHNIEVSLASSGTILCVGTSYTGVYQASYPGATASNTGTGTTVSDSITLLYDNSWTVEAQAHNGGAATHAQSNSQTERDIIDAGNNRLGTATKAHTSPGSQTLGFTLSASLEWSHAIIELAEAGGPNQGTFPMKRN